MKNKTYVILTAICLLMTALSSTLMSLSSGVCTYAAARLLRIERTVE